MTGRALKMSLMHCCYKSGKYTISLNLLFTRSATPGNLCYEKYCLAYLPFKAFDNSHK